MITNKPSRCWPAAHLRPCLRLGRPSPHVHVRGACMACTPSLDGLCPSRAGLLQRARGGGRAACPRSIPPLEALALTHRSYPMRAWLRERLNNPVWSPPPLPPPPSPHLHALHTHSPLVCAPLHPAAPHTHTTHPHTAGATPAPTLLPWARRTTASAAACCRSTAGSFTWPGRQGWASSGRHLRPRCRSALATGSSCG